MLRLIGRTRFVKAFGSTSAPMRRFGGAVAKHDDHHDDDHDHGHGHGHGHGHHKVYDWRDDPKINKDLYVDARDGDIDPSTYTFPYQGKDDWYFPCFENKVDLDDITLNVRPENRPSFDFPQLTAPYWNPDSDMAHEYDYESEDLDFQAESFHMQHFRKKGPLWGWMIIANFFVIYFWLEFIYQHYPDEVHYRVARPPPLDYPDTEDTDDTETYQDYLSKEGREFVQTGLVGDLWYDIVNGKKVYRRFAGANQPMEDI
eukprot:TRINITY_DN2574_c0_g1_i1.p1 TRINITY_DN2574_c0_g1~~TRINITY_DN2574_c0_g1_i1.p1  ORF type:complete len:258 (+),score=64.90 TRINITY_DN2574_c0_g1_i1:122-895(+)